MRSHRARQLRKKMTDAEQKLWKGLRARQLEGFKFRRQRPIGPFIVDFVCLDYRVIIEADGGQHNQSASDATRTTWLEGHGWMVIRFWNNEILGNIEGVLQRILEVLASRDPALTLTLSRKRERE